MASYVRESKPAGTRVHMDERFNPTQSYTKRLPARDSLYFRPNHQTPQPTPFYILTSNPNSQPAPPSPALPTPSSFSYGFRRRSARRRLQR